MADAGIAALAAEIAGICAGVKRISLMEICGTHTVALFRTGARSLLPDSLRLISGPGCPVCVTSQGYLDAACELALLPQVTIATYGDMVRVPGRGGSLEGMRGEGADVAVVYSARDAVKIARDNPKRQVVWLAVGFETTTPATAVAVLEAAALGLDNFSILPGHKLVIPAMEALLAGGDLALDGFLCPGHVSVIIGAGAYRPIAEKHGKPCVVAGFELAGMLRGIRDLAKQVAAGEASVGNAYGAVVSEAGNRAALALIDRVFEQAPATWRAIGEIPASGLALRREHSRFDALRRFGVEFGPDLCPEGCLCGEVIQGRATPAECSLFGEVCTPVDPIGPCMVSSEGTCAAWYKYGPKRSGEAS